MAELKKFWKSLHGWIKEIKKRKRSPEEPNRRIVKGF